jgi:hypothetical protein
MKIEFLPSDQSVVDNVPPPESAILALPQWYKDSKIKHLPLDAEDHKGIPAGLKSCTPFLDALGSGYLQKTWCDIRIEYENNQFSYYCSGNPIIMQDREHIHTPISDKYYPIEFAWMMPWIPKTPKGYSVLCSHPANRVDLPFTSLSGIIDSDNFNHMGFGQFPFYIEKGFTGVIPKGTPIIQMTPFKRDDWEADIKPYVREEQLKKEYSYFKEYFSIYRNKFWKKKTYK